VAYPPNASLFPPLVLPSTERTHTRRNGIFHESVRPAQNRKQQRQQCSQRYAFLLLPSLNAVSLAARAAAAAFRRRVTDERRSNAASSAVFIRREHVTP